MEEDWYGNPPGREGGREGGKEGEFRFR